MKYFFKFCELVTKLTVVLIPVRKANFDVTRMFFPYNSVLNANDTS